MPIDDEDTAKSQKEHGSYFSASTEEEESPESRFEPVEVDLTQPEPKKGEAPGETRAAAEELRAQLRQAQNAAVAAQRMAQEQSQRAQFAEQRAMGSTIGMIDSALETAQVTAANARAKFQAALDAADSAAAAQAQEELHDARSNMQRLQEQRAYADAEARRPAPAPQQQQQLNSIDQMASNLVESGYPRSADWLRAHPDWAARADLLDRIATADKHIVNNKGFVRETDDYFYALENELGMRPQQQQRSPGADYSHVQRRTPPAAAPTSNAAVSLRTGQPMMRSHIPLDARQREAAELSGMTEREYAREFEEARVAGKLIGYR
jgi:hypothetical protein